MVILLIWHYYGGAGSPRLPWYLLPEAGGEDTAEGPGDHPHYGGLSVSQVTSPLATLSAPAAPATTTFSKSHTDTDSRR